MIDTTKRSSALRAAGLGAALALLLAACGEQAPEGEQQGSVSPPASTDQSSTAMSAPATGETSTQ
jgi:hypothetical protein